jgi:hypothetical protein
MTMRAYKGPSSGRPSAPEIEENQNARAVPQLDPRAC